MLTGVFRVDSIKTAARKNAWYSDPNDKYGVFNPYGRPGHRNRKRNDEENPLHHSNTEDLANSPSAETRMNDMQGDALSPATRAGTFPRSSREITDDADREQQETAPTEKEEGGINSSEGSKDSTDKNVASDQSATVEAPVGHDQDGKPRRRRKFMPWKKEEANDLDRTSTEDSKKSKKFKTPPFWQQVKAVFASWINILLIAVPVGIGLEYSGVNKIAVFVVNFIAIIPLAAVLSFSTEELALYVGEVLGGLLNATFGNAVELIISIIALIQHKILIVQTSLIGSMLSNLLLVLGMCFFFGGLNRSEQFFNVTVAQTAASLLALAIGSLIIPTAFKIFSVGPNGGAGDSGVAPLSRGTSILLLVTYACYLLFQLRTHTKMYNEPGQKAEKRKSGKKEKGDVLKSIAMAGNTGANPATKDVTNENMHEEEEEGEVPQLSRIGALITLAISTVFVALCAEYMVSAIGDVTKTGGVSEEFVGLILLPIVGNAAEHATAVTVAIKDKMDLSIGVACGSSLQIALLVLPLMVLLNWWGAGHLNPGDPEWISLEQSVMTLSFDGFQVAVLFISIIVVNYLIQV
jgi:Ca2+:H+ antiporter